MVLKVSDPIAVSAVTGTGAWSAIVDLYTRRIPNRLTFGVALLGLVLAASPWGSRTLTQAALGLIVGLALMLPGHVIGATGAGDVKLFAALGTFLGPKAIAFAFLYTALAGGVIAVAVAMQRRLLRQTLGRTADLVLTAGANVGAIEHSSGNRFAYAPAIAVGSLVAALSL